MERVLWRLRLNGTLNRVAGLVFGAFTDYRPDRNFPSMEEMIRSRILDWGLEGYPWRSASPQAPAREPAHTRRLLGAPEHHARNDHPQNEPEMKALIQRVSEASVSVDGQAVSSIGRGLLVLLGVVRADGEAEADRLARKTAAMRIFPRRRRDNEPELHRCGRRHTGRKPVHARRLAASRQPTVVCRRGRARTGPAALRTLLLSVSKN